MGIDIDIDALPLISDTEAGGYYDVAPNVLLAVAHPGYAQTEDGARASLQEAHRLARVRRHAQVIIVLIDRVSSQDAAARRVWRNETDNALILGVVLVCKSMLARAIGSFLIGLTNPPVPTTMISSLEAALGQAAHLQSPRNGNDRG